MREIELDPVIDHPEDYEEIEKKISLAFREHIYLPLLVIINQPSSILKNSINVLLDAIKSGRIWFYRGEFKGRFNAAVTRELKKLGARWDRKHGSFKIPLSQLPVDLRQAIDLSEMRLESTMDQINQKINDISPEDLADSINLHKLFDTNLYRINKKIDSQLKNITVVPKLTDANRARISKEYTENMKLYIKDWTRQEIITLREEMQKNFSAGVRYEELIKTIQRRHAVSQNKAKFLARQETSILQAKFKQTRFQDIGSQKYKWKTVVGSKDHPVRPMHKIHDGKIYLWSSPPIVDKHGNRKHPGEDYGCRCTAIPIVTF